MAITVFCVYQRPRNLLYHLAQSCNDYDERKPRDICGKTYTWKRQINELHINELIDTSKLENSKLYQCVKVPCLNIACIYGSADMVAFLLSLRANPNTEDEAGNTALHAACTSRIDLREKLMLLVRIDYANLESEQNVQAIDIVLSKMVRQGRVHLVKMLKVEQIQA